MKSMKKPLIASASAAFLMGLGSQAAVAENPFVAEPLNSGYTQVADGHAGEGKCGEAKCGEDGEKREKKDGEGKCGEGSCGEKDKKREHKDDEGKCGEGKCGEE